MDDDVRERDRTRVAAAEGLPYGRLLAVSVVLLWLATMLLVLGPAAARALF